jgi:hypothetical protein
LHIPTLTERFKALDKLDLVKLAFGGKVLGSIPFSLLTQLSHKMMFDSRVVKSDSRIIISIHYSKSLTHSVKAASGGEVI